MNSKNSKTFDSDRLLLNLTDKINLRKKDKYIDLSNLSICYKQKNLYNRNNFKIPAPTWNEKFELPDESYSISDIEDHFENIWKNSKGKRRLILQ